MSATDPKTFQRIDGNAVVNIAMYFAPLATTA
jgi:hypothetical protein